MAQARAEGGTPAALARLGVASGTMGGGGMLSNCPVTMACPGRLTRAFPFLLDAAPRAVAQMRAEAVYGGYLHRQQAEIRGFAREEAVSLDGVAFESYWRAVGGNPRQARLHSAGVVRRGGADPGDDARGIGGSGRVSAEAAGGGRGG
jgi:hypothetical protein